MKTKNKKIISLILVIGVLIISIFVNSPYLIIHLKPQAISKNDIEIDKTTLGFGAKCTLYEAELPITAKVTVMTHRYKSYSKISCFTLIDGKTTGERIEEDYPRGVSLGGVKEFVLLRFKRLFTRGKDHTFSICCYKGIPENFTKNENNCLVTKIKSRDIEFDCSQF